LKPTKASQTLTGKRSGCNLAETAGQRDGCAAFEPELQAAIFKLCDQLDLTAPHVREPRREGGD